MMISVGGNDTYWLNPEHVSSLKTTFPERPIDPLSPEPACSVTYTDGTVHHLVGLTATTVAALINAAKEHPCQTLISQD